MISVKIRNSKKSAINKSKKANINIQRNYNQITENRYRVSILIFPNYLRNYKGNKNKNLSNKPIRSKKVALLYFDRGKISCGKVVDRRRKNNKNGIHSKTSSIFHYAENLKY